MAEHIWSVLCSKSVTDKETSLVSLFDVLETLGIELPGEALTEPTKAIRFSTEVVSLWRRSEPEQAEAAQDCRLDLVFPDGETAASKSISIDLSQSKRFRSSFKSDVLPLRGAGAYRFNIYLKRGRGWKMMASLPLDISIAPLEASPEAPK